MPNKDSFFSHINTVKNLSNSDLNQTADYVEAIKALSRITNSSLYIIDYEKKGFEYVSENPLFLNGHTAQEVVEMGYQFYFNYVPEEDLALLLKINTVGFDYYESIPLEIRKEYSISYDFHLITNEGKKILINQKLTPIFLNEQGKIWKAVCIVSLSTEQDAGNITVHKNNSNESVFYDLEDNCWKALEKITLSEREREITQFSIRGYTISEIAEKLFISSDTVKFHRKKLFEKLNVSNIGEAISFINNKGLI